VSPFIEPYNNLVYRCYSAPTGPATDFVLSFQELISLLQIPTIIIFVSSYVHVCFLARFCVNKSALSSVVLSETFFFGFSLFFLLLLLLSGIHIIVFFLHRRFAKLLKAKIPLCYD